MGLEWIVQAYKKGAVLKFMQRHLPGIPDGPDSRVFEEESFHIKNGRLYDFKAPTFTDHGPRSTDHDRQFVRKTTL